jgi:hypothetical protein
MRASARNFGKGLLLAIAGLLAMSALGCAGEGPEVEEGTGSQEGGGGLQATLTSIQANIFGTTCAVPGCHAGASAPFGLRLDSASESYDNLVGLTSAELHQLFRVSPHLPDESYLVWKVEGRSGIQGGRMPLGGAPLSGDKIQAIRGWIEAGAPAT